jgi:hypothetical protein
VPAVHGCVFLGPRDRGLILAVDADDDGSEELHGPLAPRADLSMDERHAPTSKDLGRIGEPATLIAISGDADGHVLGDRAKFITSKLGRCRPHTGFGLHDARQ